MLKELLARLRQGYRTMPFPRPAPALPDRYRGLPVVDTAACAGKCKACEKVCPTGAVAVSKGPSLDLGRCVFCGACSQACPSQAIRFSADYCQSARKREDLVLAGVGLTPARALEGKARRLFGRSLKLRQVSAGGCNACEADVNVLSTIGFDLGRFGIQFVASPRHADGLLVTGPVTRNMQSALLKTYAAVPAPKLVIASGACAISGGIYSGQDETCGGADRLLPVDLYVPGCPPHPLTVLDGLLRLLGRL